jgi:hypothetical protein
MAQNQNSGAVQAVKMDSRKFLSALNDSAQAKIAFFEERVQEMGRQARQELASRCPTRQGPFHRGCGQPLLLGRRSRPQPRAR